MNGPRLLLLAIVACLAGAPRLHGVPPLVIGDVPTAPKESFELYLGYRYQEGESGASTQLLPFTELVYGLSDRQELTFEIAGLSKDGNYGVSDAVVGTKYVFLNETAHWPGIAGSFELKLPTGDEDRGLGSGEFDYDLRLRAQKTWGWFTAIGNVGYTFISEPSIGGVGQPRDNVLLLAFAQEYQVGARTKLLSEVYFLTAEEPGAHDRLGANIGFKHKVRDDLALHASVGGSVWEGSRGDGGLRAYVGLKYEFGAPWC